MSITLPALRGRIQVKIRETDDRLPTYDIVEIDQAIRSATMSLAADLPPIKTYTASAFTISAAADTFTLPVAASEEYRGQIRIQLQSDLGFLRECTVEEIDAFREGEDSSYQATPERYALWEDASGVVQTRCNPRARVPEVCNLFATLVIADFTLAAMDSTTIYIGRDGIEALALQTAAELLAGMTEEDLAKRRLNPRVAESWMSRARRLAYKEGVRKLDLHDIGRIQRWVS